MANEQSKAPEQAAPVTQEPTEPPQPRYMTADEYNAASTARERRFEQRLSKMLEERFAAIAAQQPAAAAANQGEPAAGAQSDQSAEIKKYNARLEAMQKQMEAEKAAAAKERADMLLRQERTEVQSLLTEHGVMAPKHVYAAWKDEGRIGRNADGELVMKVTRDYGEDEVPIAVAIKEWLTTQEAKLFLPPRGGGEGSGTVIRGGASRGGAPLSKEEAKAEARKMLSAFVLGNRE